MAYRQARSAVSHPVSIVTSLRTALSGVLVSLIMLFLVILADFQQRQKPGAAPPDAASIGIVFTGQFDRIETALQLFDDGRFSRLLISGVGPGSGLRPETIADQFDFSPQARAALQTGEIFLSPDPVDTFDNAAEAACWLRAQPGSAGEDVILITSVSHMPRASITLERALPPGTKVYRISPPFTDLDRLAQKPEQGKFIYSWIATLFPKSQRPADYLTLCTGTPAP